MNHQNVLFFHKKYIKIQFAWTRTLTILQTLFFCLHGCFLFDFFFNYFGECALKLMVLGWKKIIPKMYFQQRNVLFGNFYVQKQMCKNPYFQLIGISFKSVTQKRLCSGFKTIICGKLFFQHLRYIHIINRNFDNSLRVSTKRNIHKANCLL